MEQYLIMKHVLLEDFNDEHILFNLEHGLFGEINDIGKMILSMLKEPKTLTEVSKEIVNVCDVDTNEIENDVLEFLNTMLNWGYIEKVSYEKRKDR